MLLTCTNQTFELLPTVAAALLLAGCTAEPEVHASNVGQRDAASGDARRDLDADAAHGDAIDDTGAPEPDSGATPDAWPVDVPGTHVLSVTHEGFDHEVRLAIGEQKTTGAVLLLHGSGQTAQSFLQRRQTFVQLAFEQGWVVVVPQAGTELRWNFASLESEAPDREFLLHVVDELDAQNVPGSRWVAGFSNGGRMAHALMAHAPQRFGAGGMVASNLGVLDVNGTGEDRLVPPASGPASIWMANGSMDPSVPFDGGPAEVGIAPSVDDAVDFWTTASECAGAPTQVDFADGYTQTWSACADGREVVQAAYRTSQHAWPENVQGWDPNRALRDFFLAHP